MEKLNQLSGRAVYVDLIRTIAIVGVILLHAAGEYTVTTQQMSQMNQSGLISWFVVDIYQSFALIGVPLFLMLTGTLLLQPGKNESLSVFFKKRWSRIGLPFVFWGAAYFLWDFLVIKYPFSLLAIIEGILSGPYTQFWYLYVLIGLYIWTPILRVFIAHADQTLMKYFVIVWFLGTSMVPVFSLLSASFTLQSNVFTIPEFVGFFVIGIYLSTLRLRRSTLAIFMVVGLALTAIFTYVMATTVGGTEMYFFEQYFSPTVILASVMAFSLLLTIPPPQVQQEISPKENDLKEKKALPKENKSKINKLIAVISANTLALYLFHVMVLESLKNGYFGFAINRYTLNPIIEVPLMTAIVLFVSLAIILLLKKVPYLKKLIG